MCCLSRKNIGKQSQVFIEHMAGNVSDFTITTCAHCLLVVILNVEVWVKRPRYINEFKRRGVSRVIRCLLKLVLFKLVVTFFYDYSFLVIKEEIDQFFRHRAVTSIKRRKPF